jgi:hypothetical protein
MLVVSIFDSHEPFGLVYVRQRLERNAAVDEEGEASSAVVPTVHRTYFRGFSTDILFRI